MNKYSKTRHRIFFFDLVQHIFRYETTDTTRAATKHTTIGLSAFSVSRALGSLIRPFTREKREFVG